jgi:hypothetical protein
MTNAVGLDRHRAQLIASWIETDSREIGVPAGSATPSKRNDAGCAVQR